jgi:hypothetical protein
MDLLGTPGECRQQAARCQTLAETADDQRVRALLVSMNEMWTKLADEAERLNGQHQGKLMLAPERPKSRLETHAPQCAKCKTPMRVRILIPGRKVDDVSYRCEKCGVEEMRSVPRVW